MLMVFERVPDLFVQIYHPELTHWAARPDKVGMVATIMLRRPIEPIPFAKDQRRIVGVRLRAHVDKTRTGDLQIVVRPSSEADAEAIARHVVDMRPQILH
jgi:hypothetical protein